MRQRQTKFVLLHTKVLTLTKQLYIIKGGKMTAEWVFQEAIKKILGFGFTEIVKRVYNQFCGKVNDEVMIELILKDIAQLKGGQAELKTEIANIWKEIAELKKKEASTSIPLFPPLFVTCSKCHGNKKVKNLIALILAYLLGPLLLAGTITSVVYPEYGKPSFEYASNAAKAGSAVIFVITSILSVGFISLLSKINFPLFVQDCSKCYGSGQIWNSDHHGKPPWKDNVGDNL